MRGSSLAPRAFQCHPASRLSVAVVSVRGPPVGGRYLHSGRRRGAHLSLEKLAPIEDFVNGEIAAGNIPGAIVLIQRHGKPVYFKCFGQRDVDEENRR